MLLQEELSQMEMNEGFHEHRSPEALNKMAVLAISYHNIGSSWIVCIVYEYFLAG